ncbi:MAG: hypothetical protein ACHQFW_09620 [Chitinophagales bacterium]
MKFNNRNVNISKKAAIGTNVRIGDDTIIYDNVVVEDGSVICNNCIIGEPENAYYSETSYENAFTRIKKNALIRSHTIIYSGCTLGENFSTGHRVTIREQTYFGDNCRVGTLSDIQGFAEFGNYCWIHSNAFIAQYTSVKDFVFIYPQVCFANDPHPPSSINRGPSIDNFAQIGAKSIILAGVKIGTHALVGAGSVVVDNVGAHQLVLGNPAKYIKDVREIKSREFDGMQYPWPYHFDRSMPWKEIGFEKWLGQNPQYSK